MTEAGQRKTSLAVSDPDAGDGFAARINDGAATRSTAGAGRSIATARTPRRDTAELASQSARQPGKHAMDIQLVGVCLIDSKELVSSVMI